jgi:hypothetical protein
MASTTARPRSTAPARKRATPKPTSLGEAALDFEPIRIAADDEVIEERIPLFFIGDTKYTIPKNIPPGVALEYLRRAGELGQEMATPPLLIRVLGEDAYLALEQSKAVTEEQLEQIVQLIIDLAMGRKEKKEGGKASR